MKLEATQAVKAHDSREILGKDPSVRENISQLVSQSVS